MALFVLPPFRAEDRHALLRHASHPSVAANLTGLLPAPFSENAARAFIQSAIQGPSLRRDRSWW